MNALTCVFGIINILILAESIEAALPGNGTKNASSKIHNFKVDLHRALEGLRVRNKRQLEVPQDTMSNQMRVGSATAGDLPYLSDYRLTFWIPVEYYGQRQVLVGTKEGNLMLFQLSEDDDRQGHMVASSYEEEVAIKAKAFTYYDEQWFIILQTARNQTWIRLYLKVGRGLEQRQSIPLDGETDFDLVTLKGIHYMAVATYQQSRNTARLALYHWTQTQFDVIATRTVNGPRSIACWVLDGTLYIVLAQRMEDENEFRYGSPVFLYNAKDEHGLVLQQMLSVEGPVKVLHFYVNSNHYVIFIGRQNAAIYWWTSNQFLLWQIIQYTANAVDASILALENGEVVIVIALREEVLFITLDGSGHYMVTFTMKFFGYDLSSFQFIYSGKAYYALALFAATSYTQQVQPVWKMTLDSYSVSTGSSLDTLRQCLNDVVVTQEERQNEIINIQADLNRVWSRNIEQRINPMVFVEGKTSSSKKCVVSQIKVVRMKNALPASSLSAVDQSLSTLKAIVYDLKKNLQNSVRKSVQQDISGTKHFHEPFYVPSLMLTYSSLDIPLNGVPVMRANQYALRKYGDQKFETPLQLTNVHSNNLNTDYLNGIETNDFLLLQAEHQHVRGNLTFVNVQVNSIATDTVNSIPYGNLVTTSGDQTIRGLKGISSMQSDTLGVQGQTNGEILKDTILNIVRIDQDGELNGHITLDTIAHIRGDIFLTGKLNGYIDIAQLLDGVVSKDARQQIKGRKIFESPVIVNNDLVVNGHTNDLQLSQLMTLSSDQTIPGNFVFNTLSVNGDLTTDSINDLKLKADAVLKTSDPQFVMGSKCFLQEVTTDFIDMTEYITLDGVDPSLLVQDLVKHKEGLVKEDMTVFPNAVILGNLTVIGGINGRDVFDLPYTVWLRKKNQDIEIPVSWKIIKATHIFVTMVNTVYLDSDVVRSYGDETIVSFKHFRNDVRVTNVESSADVTINGLNTISLKSEIENYVNDGTVHGIKTLGHIEIAGDLEAPNFNGFDILGNVMRPQDYQVISAPVIFLAELAVVKDSLGADSLWFDRFNSLDLRSIFEDSIQKIKPKLPIVGKTYTNLKAQSLNIPMDGVINDIPISGLLGKVVTLNSDQQITGDKTFTSDLIANNVEVDNVNERSLPSTINQIVFPGDNRPISSKEFLGAFNLPNIKIHGPINGIDVLQMSKNIFDKSKNTDLLHPVTFLNGIELGNLVADSLDGIDWYELISTNRPETLDALKIEPTTNVQENVFVTGLVNGCDIEEIKKNALYSTKSTQVIQEEITIENIEVIGNIYIDEVVNQVPVQNLIKKLILVTGDQIVTSDVVLEAGALTKSLILANAIENFNLPFIMSDAVRQSVPQIINGYKRFKSLASDVLEAKELFVSEYLQDIIAKDLYENIIWKTGHQSVESEKIFNSFKTDVATVHGLFNGLNLPNDIVKVDTTETINSSTMFMSDLIVAADLDVKGELDGVNIEDLIQNRVTLSTDQNANADLNFQSDIHVKSDFQIEGTINGIALESIAKTSHNVPLDGYKLFVTDFSTKGSLVASSINHHNIQSLDQIIIRNNREEFVKDLQVFEKPLTAGSHLFADSVNEIPLSRITSTFFTLVNTLNRTLNYLKDLSFGFWKQLGSQLNVVGKKVSKFAYFILLQEINLGPTMKILQGYRMEHSSSEFSHSMVIWTSQKQCTYLEKCCHEEFSYWMRVKKSGHLMVDSESEPGRLYPISDPVPMNTGKDIFIWTNATGYQPKWCGDGKDEKMMLASLTDLKYLDVFMDIKNAPTLSDIKSFRKVHLYAVAGFYYNRRENIYSNAIVYIFNDMKREWSEHQVLPSVGVLSLDVTQYSDDKLLLAVGSGIGTHSSVYEWDDIQQEFKILQYISSTYVTSTLWLKHGSTQLLAMANVDSWPSKEAFCTELVSGGQIDIYSYDTNIRWIQSIPISGVVSLVHFTLEGETFLVAASGKLQTVFIYEWRGYGGFSLVQSLFVGEVTHLNTYRIEDNFYMTVATVSGPAKVLKVVTEGKHPVFPSQHTHSVLPALASPEAQRDEAVKEEKAGC